MSRRLLITLSFALFFLLASAPTSGMRCYVNTDTCICLDPAPADYDRTSCPSLPCCHRLTSGSPRECTCTTFTGADCDNGRAGETPTTSCP